MTREPTREQIHVDTEAFVEELLRMAAEFGWTAHEHGLTLDETRAQAVILQLQHIPETVDLLFRAAEIHRSMTSVGARARAVVGVLAAPVVAWLGKLSDPADVEFEDDEP